MQVVCRNYVKNQQLYHTFDEPLFLKPDGNRTRYCIGWNGKGRYLPGTLKVTYNGLPCNITEEDNGIFYNFSIAPGNNTNYEDYTITYTARPLDYAFATGHELGGYPNEEYFLFPNWNNAKGEGNAFWVGRWMTSDSNDVVYSKIDSQVTCDHSLNDYKRYCTNKGNTFHIMRNREYCSILLWADHHEIEWKGNTTANNSGSGLDGDGTILPSNIIGDASCAVVNKSGYAPNTWFHNHNKDTGIESLYGNKLIVLEGIKVVDNQFYIFDDNNANYVATGLYQLTNGNEYKYFTALCNDNDMLNECIPVSSDYSGNKFYPSMIGKSSNLSENKNELCCRSLFAGWNDHHTFDAPNSFGMFNVGGNGYYDTNRTIRIVRDLIN